MREKAKTKKIKNKPIINLKYLILIPAIIALFIFLPKTLIGQIEILAKQEKDYKYYKAEREKLEKQNKELEARKEKINSNEYIEDIAREKLDMYYPNEKIYLDSSLIDK